MKLSEAKLELALKDEQELVEKFNMTEEDVEFLHKILKNEGRPAISDKQSILKAFDISDNSCVSDIFFEDIECFKLLPDEKHYLFDYSWAYASTRGDDLDFRKIAMAEMGFVPFSKSKEDIKKTFELSEDNFNEYVRTGLLEHWCYAPLEDYAFYIMTESFRDMYPEDNE